MKGEGEDGDNTQSSLWRRLVKWAVRWGQTVDDGEDLVQSAFEKLEETIQSGASVRNVEPFLKTTTRHLAIDHHRRERGAVFVGDPVEELQIESGELGPAETTEIAELMQKACDALLAHHGKRTYAIFFHHRVYGRTYEEIGKIMRMSPRTAERHVAKALQFIFEYTRRSGD